MIPHKVLYPGARTSLDSDEDDIALLRMLPSQTDLPRLSWR